MTTNDTTACAFADEGCTCGRPSLAVVEQTELERLRAELEKADEITTNIQTDLNAKVGQLYAEIKQLRAKNDQLRSGLLAEAAAHRETRGQLTAANHHADGLTADLRDMQQANTAYANQVAAMRPVIEAAKVWRNNTGTYSRYNDELALVAAVDAMPKLAEVSK